MRPPMLLLFPLALCAHMRDGSLFQVRPSVIEMGAFYSGKTVLVHGLAANGARVIVTATGPKMNERFNVRGRAGPIWLNSGRIHVKGVPSMLLRFSSGPVASMLPPEAIEQRSLD